MIGFIWFIVAVTIFAIFAPFVMRFLFPHRVLWREVAASIALSIVFSVVCSLVVIYGGSLNTEILNGKVTNKAQEQVSCEHSYQVCSGSGENRVCTTYYEHSYDYDWVVHTTVGEIVIDRVDRQGTKEPPRFSKVKIGEHAAVSNTYVDYLKGIESSLLYRKNHKIVKEYERLIPSYPRVFDYYRTRPVIFSGISVDNAERKMYNDAMHDVLKEIGNSKQVNIIVVIVDSENPEFAEYLRNDWHNGRKNDQIVVIGAPEYPKVEWSYSFGWSKKQDVNPSIDYDVTRLEHLSPEALAETVKTNVVKHFKRRPMEEFKSYLWETEIELWKFVLVFFLQIAFNAGLSYWWYRNDIY